MINSKIMLRAVLNQERKNYFPSKRALIKAYILGERNFYIWKYQSILRKLELYNFIRTHKNNIFSSLIYSWYSLRLNKLGIRIGIDTWHSVFDRGLVIHHVAGGIIVNSKAKIGKNCHLHGNNCIGNNGKNEGVPQIGDNCRIGVGAKIIGNICLGDNITVAAGAVVTKSCLEENVILAGIPAVVKYKKES